jgi:hypothetical protein
MSEHEALGFRAVYDHEADEPRRGRRRAVADWGVGDEMFEHLPRRRFRASDGQRRDTHVRRLEPRERPAEPEPREWAPRESTRSEPEPRETTRRELEARERARVIEPVSLSADTVEHVIEPVAEPPELEPHAEEPVAEPEPVVTEPPAAVEPLSQPETGRRTVVIRGHGAEGALMPRRHRPPKTVGERLGPRPDRVAAWAVALGLLLILIAILTAHG